ncbi:MAG: hypothetical protein KTR29_17275 [Rhodothermaceae bacterium]|nr:hypothetical protein [Rhodothermaceae bacterium]
MSLLAIIFIAILIPFVVFFLGFTWFFIWSRVAKLTTIQKPNAAEASKEYHTRLGAVQAVQTGGGSYDYVDDSKADYGIKPIYKPLSHFLESNTDLNDFSGTVLEKVDAGEALTVIPGVSKELAGELYSLGYSSIEQIARWGRADVRSVSADLGIDQQLIEEVWIANARLIMSVRSTSYTS